MVILMLVCQVCIDENEGVLPDIEANSTETTGFRVVRNPLRGVTMVRCIPTMLAAFSILIEIISLQQGSRLFAADLNESLKPLIEAHSGDVAVCIRHLETGEQFVWRGDDVQPTASLIKMPVMVAAYRMVDGKELDLAEMIDLEETDKVPGSGILTTHFSAGLQLSLRDAIRLMIRYSDNTATNLVVDEIGLPTTAATMEALGFPQTRLNSKVYRGETSIAPDRSKLYGLGSTTANETVNLLELLHKGTAASAESCKAMLDHLLACDDKTMLASQLPEGTRVAHKSGAVSESRCNAGIIYGPKGPFAICVLTTKNKDKSWKDDNAAHVLIGSIARIAFDHFNPEWERTVPNEAADLRIGAFGTRVEFLQRTLNARTEPSPGLGVDGDFGPATEAAVRKFQEANGLAVTGVADAELWKKLGPVIEETSIAAPEVINAEMLPQLPAEPLDGVPFVSCDSWIVVDASDGRMLAGAETETSRHFASTTKIMTAWLVAGLAEKHPEVLDEMLTMSVRADETRGSTADIRAGESVPVREALYGLMLPSGNDMSVALAEHFGPRLTAAVPDENSAANKPKLDPLELFVTAMNAEAARLGMMKTHYTNPHGLTNESHQSTVADLAILARATVNSPLLRKYTSTRQRGARVIGPGGYTRNVLWKNTNELLGTEGYDGIKTGTTDQAGACLVSTGERDGKRLIVVVLGSAASESRYTDSRNLYRYGWNLLLAK
ncbi:MAG: serine hydrolase [Planctomycetaceae bacterium]